MVYNEFTTRVSSGSGWRQSWGVQLKSAITIHWEHPSPPPSKTSENMLQLHFNMLTLGDTYSLVHNRVDVYTGWRRRRESPMLLLILALSSTSCLSALFLLNRSWSSTVCWPGDYWVNQICKLFFLHIHYETRAQVNWLNKYNQLIIEKVNANDLDGCQSKLLVCIKKVEWLDYCKQTML